LPGSWFAPTSSIYAIRYRGIVAATAKTSARSYALHHGIVLPYKRESSAAFKPTFTKFIQDPDFTSPEEDKDFDLVLSAVRAGRSLAASYNLQSNIQREFLYLTLTMVGAERISSLHPFPDGQ